MELHIAVNVVDAFQLDRLKIHVHHVHVLPVHMEADAVVDDVVESDHLHNVISHADHVDNVAPFLKDTIVDVQDDVNDEMFQEIAKTSEIIVEKVVVVNKINKQNPVKISLVKYSANQ